MWKCFWHCSPGLDCCCIGAGDGGSCYLKSRRNLVWDLSENDFCLLHLILDLIIRFSQWKHVCGLEETSQRFSVNGHPHLEARWIRKIMLFYYYGILPISALNPISSALILNCVHSLSFFLCNKFLSVSQNFSLSI